MSTTEVKREMDWLPTIEKFSRRDLEQSWPRVLTVESALFASGLHKTSCCVCG